MYWIPGTGLNDYDRAAEAAEEAAERRIEQDRAYAEFRRTEDPENVLRPYDFTAEDLSRFDAEDAAMEDLRCAQVDEHIKMLTEGV